MKKTLIAVAVAATAAVSGSAMAADWINGSTGGNAFEIEGTISLETQKSPWEVAVGDTKSIPAIQIASGTQEVSVSLDDNIPVLGIRSVAGGFQGSAFGSGLVPHISFNGGSISSQSFGANGLANLKLEIKNNNQQVIGSLSSKLQAVGLAQHDSDASSLNASKNTDAFLNGLPRTEGNSVAAGEAVSVAEKLFPGVLQNWNNSVEVRSNYAWGFTNTGKRYNAAYAAGIPSGTQMTLNLNEPVTTETDWKASLPITISYN